MRKRHQYRMLQAAFMFALIGIAFFGSYQGIRYSEKGEGHQSAQHGSPEAKPEKFSWDWATHDPVAMGTFVLCFVTAALAVVTGGLYIATARLARDADRISRQSLNVADRAAEAAQEAASVARQDLISTHRPWISVQVAIGPRGLYFDTNGANLDLVFTLKNIGATPAAALRIEGGPRIQITDELIELDKICTDSKGRPPDPNMWGHTLFPKEFLTIPVIYLFASKEDLGRLQRERKGFMRPFIIGCADYTFTFGDSAHHQSCFIYELYWHTPDGIRRVIDINDSDNAANILGLERSNRARAFHAD
jgi:hypothetical protein